MNDYQIQEFNGDSSDAEFGLLIVAAGFEDRAFEYLDEADLRKPTNIVVIRFDNELEINQKISKKYLSRARTKVGGENVHDIVCLVSSVETFFCEFNALIKSLHIEMNGIAIDISGMPSHVIFTVLESVRKARLYNEQAIIYTSATEYLPSFAEYEKLLGVQHDDIEYIPKSLALETDKNLVFEPFEGYRRNELNPCLFLYAGYEAHRSTGVIEAINPTITLFLYGAPASEGLEWRKDLSKRVHAKFEKMLRCASETVSTQNVYDSIQVLEDYYNYLLDDYDVTIAPLGSKLQTLACFLFWERYPEIRITFPLPIGYDPSRRPRGVDKTYMLKIPGRLGFSSTEKEN